MPTTTAGDGGAISRICCSQHFLRLFVLDRRAHRERGSGARAALRDAAMVPTWDVCHQPEPPNCKTSESGRPVMAVAPHPRPGQFPRTLPAADGWPSLDHVDDGHLGVHGPAHHALEVVPTGRRTQRQSIGAPAQDGRPLGGDGHRSRTSWGRRRSTRHAWYQWGSGTSPRDPHDVVDDASSRIPFVGRAGQHSCQDGPLSRGHPERFGGCPGLRSAAARGSDEMLEQSASIEQLFVNGSNRHDWWTR